jgi:hypothetical protein
LKVLLDVLWPSLQQAITPYQLLMELLCAGDSEFWFHFANISIMLKLWWDLLVPNGFTLQTFLLCSNCDGICLYPNLLQFEFFLAKELFKWKTLELWRSNLFWIDTGFFLIESIMDFVYAQIATEMALMGFCSYGKLWAKVLRLWT